MKKIIALFVVCQSVLALETNTLEIPTISIDATNYFTNSSVGIYWNYSAFTNIQLGEDYEGAIQIGTNSFVVVKTTNVTITIERVKTK